MNSVVKLNKLANFFEAKINKFAQDQMRYEDTNVKAKVSDALFGPPALAKNQETFLNFINRPESNFQKSIQNIPGSIAIGGKVNIPVGMADITVSCPGEKPDSSKKVRLALLEDYRKHFGGYPKDRVQERLRRKEIQPDAVGEYPDIITL